MLFVLLYLILYPVTAFRQRKICVTFLSLAVYRCRNYMSTVYILYFSTNFSLFLCLFLPFSVYRLLSGTEKDSAAYFFRGVSLFFLFHAEPRTTRLTGMVVTFGTISPFLLRSIYAMESSDISSIG